MADYTILLEGLEVAIGLGIHPHEQAPQRVRLHVEMACRYEAPPEDRIEAVVDYDFLRSEIHALAGSQHFALQETLCDRVAALALRDPRVFEVRVRSMKLDIYPDAQIGCEITRRR
ncbi:dihydroneopterin aldolase [Sphingomonas sp. MMS12-HWE2-04]|uniref:dihydroneopterin aldolase n=1 Tax=Sphingomonas sp. MMS12-HWE2-04 TaxID=3234199 RepID=UPI00385149FC